MRRAVSAINSFRPLAVTLLGLSLSACSGSGAGLNSDGQPLAGGGSGLVPLSADFDAIQADVFTPICSVCHSGAGAPQGLMLDAAHSYDLLVNIPSTEVPTILRVDPGNPADSYIIQKLEGHAAVGAQMPLGEGPLPASTIAFIVQWITDGAQPGAAAAAVAAEFRITAVAPENGSALTAPPRQLVIGFTHELDATQISAASARLERSAEADRPQSPAPVPVALTVPLGNPRALLLVPDEVLIPGQYRLVLSAQPGSRLSDRDGELLNMPQPDADGDLTISRFTVTDTP
jgi:hypothetical protein